VGDDEKAAVHRAAEFLAGDIEKISGYRPPVVKTPGGDRVAIRLVTLGHPEAPAAIDTAAMQGQWESYRIVTADGTVWLVGSNPRGTAFAGYTLSERLGIDPLQRRKAAARGSRARSLYSNSRRPGAMGDSGASGHDSVEHRRP